ncbi:MAG: hypothetical protein IPL28_04550 [Chloroflexi bacterium]|nr:hypothetical protein [Chloroflexota bacterium]
MLKFAKYAPYMPDIAPARPHITAEERARAAAVPAEAVPFHCKPWLDGQSIGYTICYGYLSPITITSPAPDQLEVQGGEQATRERQGNPIAQTFAQGHFGLGSGYTLQTPPGTVCLIVPANNPPPHLQLVMGLVETSWYPKPLFLVYQLPPQGVAIALDYKMELARVLVIPQPQVEPAEQLSAEALLALETAANSYSAEEKQAKAWFDNRGQRFTHLYKTWSQRHKKPVS